MSVAFSSFAWFCFCSCVDFLYTPPGLGPMIRCPKSTVYSTLCVVGSGAIRAFLYSMELLSVPVIMVIHVSSLWASLLSAEIPCCVTSQFRYADAKSGLPSIV